MASPCPTAVELKALLDGTLPPAARARIDQHLEGCGACRQEINTLAGGNESWLKTKHVPCADPLDSPPLRERMNQLKGGQRAMADDSPEKLTRQVARLRYLGDHEILGELGRGGMGVVYRARQLSLQREVAVKVILAGQLASSADVRRFRVEAEAAAKLDHPHIVPIFEIAEYQGHHFFSMKLVEGGSLAERSSEFRASGFESGDTLSNAELKTRNTKLARLMATIARAVHYAHQRGVLHRDLKPSNILMDRSGQPHLTDFGLAKLLEHDSGLTYSAAIMGTPNYLAPEAAAGKAKEVTTAVDVYSLGSILYELLTGRPPFQADSPAQTLRLAVEAEPVSPMAHNRAVPSDLATICLKCLEKEPLRRYASAELFAEELDRFIRGEPILAHPTTSVERVVKWTRRKPALAGSLAALVMVFVVGFAGVLWKWRGEVHHRRLAQQAVTRLDSTVTQLEIERAESLLQAGDSSRGLAYLARLLRQQPTNFVVAERLMSALSDRSFCLPVAPLRHGKSLDTLAGERKQQLANRFPFEKPGSVVAANFSHDGGRVVTTSKDGTARIWNALDGQPISEPMRHDAEVLWAQFSGDGSKVVTASVDGTAKIWSAATGQLAAPPLRHDDIVFHASFSPDGEKVTTASRDRTVRIWNTQTGEPIGAPLRHPAPAYFACFSPDSSHILSADDGDIDFARLWDAQTGTALASAEHFYFVSAPIPFPSFSPAQEQVVTLLWHAALLLNSDSKLARSAVLLHDGFCMGATYSPDGRHVATVSSDTTARLWDTRTGETTIAPLRHDAPVSMADFSADGQQLLTCSRDKSTRLWETRTGQALTEPMRQEHGVLAARISANGQRVATVSETDNAWLWDVRRLQPLVILRRLPIVPLYARFSRDSRQLVVVDESDHARVWSVQSGAFQTKLMNHAANSIIVDAQFSPDGRRLLTSCEDRTMQVWDPLTGDALGPRWRSPRTAHRIRFSPDGRRVITASNDGIARLLDAETGQAILELRHSDRVLSVEFSVDGSFVVTASADATARIWEAATGRPLSQPLPHDAEVYYAEFDRAARRVATASKDKTVRLWSAQTGQMLAPPLVHADSLQSRNSVTFSPDGSRLATAAGNAVQVWDASTGRAIITPLRHGGLVGRIQFSPDGRKLLTACEDGTARLWDPQTGHPVSEPLRHGAGVTSAEFSPDGRRVVTCSADMAVRVWEVTSAPLPVPDWLPLLAEAVAGHRLDAQNVSEVVSVERLYQLRQKLAANDEPTFYHRWARWFFADSASRAISASSETTVSQYVQRRIDDGTRESLREATLLSVTNAIAFARLAENLSTIQKSGPHKARAFPEDAEWFSRYATNGAPNDLEVRQIRKVVVERLQNSPTSPKP